MASKLFQHFNTYNLEQLSFTPPDHFDLEDFEYALDKLQRNVINNNQSTTFVPIPEQRVELLTNQQLFTTQECFFQKVTPIDKAIKPMTQKRDLVSHDFFIQERRVISTFVPHKGGGFHKVNVPLTLNITGTEMVGKAIEIYCRETEKELIYMDVKAYQLRVAEEDGQPDTSYPPLNKNSLIQQLGNVKFTLVIDSNYESINNGEKTIGMTKLDGKFPSSSVKDIRLKVFLPPQRKSNDSFSPNSSNNYQLTYFKIVPVSPELLVRDLKKLLCHRFDLNSSKFSLKSVVNENNLKEINKKHQDKTLCSLGSDLELLERIVIVRIAAEDDIVTEEKTQTYFPLVMNEEESFYVFHVIKTNNFGARQERILSFDSENIYNSKPYKSYSKRSQNVKHPIRPISSLECVEHDSKNQKQFVLSFGYYSILYEADTTVEAETIVKRLSQFITMKRINHN